MHRRDSVARFSLSSPVILNSAEVGVQGVREVLIVLKLASNDDVLADLPGQLYSSKLAIPFSRAAAKQRAIQLTSLPLAVDRYQLPQSAI